MLLDIIRLIAGTAFLTYASYTDVKTRRVKNRVWLLMAGIGFIILMTDMLNNGLEPIYYLTLIPIALLFLTAFVEPYDRTDLRKGQVEKRLWFLILVVGLGVFIYLILTIGSEKPFLQLMLIPTIVLIAYALYYLRLLFGGADAKSMMTIAVIAPFYPAIYNLPLYTSFAKEFWPFPIVILTNGLILSLGIPLAYFFYNLGRGDIGFPQCFLGYRVELKKVKNSFVWLMERVVDEEHVLVLFPKKEIDVDEEVRKLEERGIEHVWVTPKIPFMVPLTVGYFFAFILGDIMYYLVSLSLPY